MATLTNEQIEQKKQQLKQLSEEINAISKELQEAGAWPLSDDDLDDVAGGWASAPPPHGSSYTMYRGNVNEGIKPCKDGVFF